MKRRVVAVEKESILKDRTIVGSPLTHLFSLGILMFVFWLALSGDFAVKFVVYGLITSAVVAWICYPTAPKNILHWVFRRLHFYATVCGF
mgnify:CR=1 FL=1